MTSETLPPFVISGSRIPEGVEPRNLTDLSDWQKRKSVAVPLDHIQATLAWELHGWFPDALVRQFGWDALRWQRVTLDDNLHAMWIGGSDRPAGIEQASATITLVRGINPDRYVNPQDVRFASVGVDSRGNKRVVAAVLGGQPTYRVHEVDISIGTSEIPNSYRRADGGFNWDSLHLVHAPTSLDYPLWTGGFVTDAMVRQVNPVLNPEIGMLRFFDAHKSGAIADMQLWDIPVEHRRILARSTGKDGIVIVNGEHFWKFSFPRNLQHHNPA